MLKIITTDALRKYMAKKFISHDQTQEIGTKLFNKLFLPITSEILITTSSNKNLSDFVNEFLDKNY